MSLLPPRTVGKNIYVDLTVGGWQCHRVVGGVQTTTNNLFHKCSFITVAILAQAISELSLKTPPTHVPCFEGLYL